MAYNKGFAGLWDQLLSEGQVTVTLEEVETRSSSSPGSVRVAVAEAQRRHQLFSPVRGLYVLVPPQYRSQGTVPADWFLDDLCRHLGRHYYLGYLSAAARHGASHQAVQVTQVVVDRRVPDRSFGSVRLRFYADGRMAHWPAVAVAGPTGTLRVASPETCAFDLASDTRRGGGASSVATVLQELDLDPQELADQGRDRPRASVRRLGFLLERAGKEVGLGSLQELAHPGTSRTLLDPAGPKYGDVDRRWSVIVNTTVEPEG